MREKHISMFLWSVLSVFAYMLKISSLVGSFGSFFSALNIVGPLTVFYLGIPASIVFFIARTIGIKFLFGSAGTLILAFKLPTLCAGMYMRYNHAIVRLGIPALCMILFVMHPTGAQAWFYSVYWFIPMIVYYSASRTSIFLQALGCTYTAHAVGSVLWLYAIPMEAALFAQLMPIVFVERLVYALGITLGMNIAAYVLKKRNWPFMQYVIQ